jgi:hypothetical protein
MTQNKLFPALPPFGLLDAYGGAIARADHVSTGSPYGGCAPPTLFNVWVLLGRMGYTGAEGDPRAGIRNFSVARFFCLFSDR